MMHFGVSHLLPTLAASAVIIFAAYCLAWESDWLRYRRETSAFGVSCRIDGIQSAAYYAEILTDPDGYVDYRFDKGIGETRELIERRCEDGRLF